MTQLGNAARRGVRIGNKYPGSASVPIDSQWPTAPNDLAVFPSGYCII
jgi:hypothetical protein